MKKQIFINGRFLTQSITGVQRFAHEIVKSLDSMIDAGLIDKEQFSFTLLHPAGKKKHIIGLKHIKIVQRGWLSGNLWEQFELPFYTFGSLLVSMCMVSTLFKRKQIVVIHDASCYVNPTFFSYNFRTWYRFAISILGKIAAKIITVSDFSKTELVKHANISEHKISVIYNAADHILNFEEPSQEFKNKVDKLKPYLLAVSSLGKNKNYGNLSKAVNEVKFKEYKMVIAGGITSSTLAKTETAESDVLYMGYVLDSELKYLYKNASLFIFPSIYEGFGIPPLEAMLLGCPVLSSNTSAMPEILKDSCDYLDPFIVKDIKEHIENLIEDSEYLSVLKSKGATNAKMFSWQNSAFKFFEEIKHYA